MNRKPVLIFFIFCCFLCIRTSIIYGQVKVDINSDKTISQETPRPSRLLDRSANETLNDQLTVSSTNFDVTFYRCEWEIDPAISYIKGIVTPYFNITLPTDSIIFDLSDTLTVDSIVYHGSKISFATVTNDGLQINFPSTLPAGKKDSISIYYNGYPRQSPSHAGFYQSSHGAVPLIYTLSEPYGAKEWWPCKNGLDDKADSIEIVITNPDIYQASSNGLQINETIANSKKTSTWRHNYPIASYLVAIGITNYVVLKDTVMLGNGKILDIIDYAYPEYKDLFNAQRSFTKYSLHLFGGLFGEYPFAKEKYGLTQFNANGGMEHQTNSFVLIPGGGLVIHETAHQWFGDKITCGKWEDIWLNEGFATYCQLLYNESIDPIYLWQSLQFFGNFITSIPSGSVWVNDTTSFRRIFSSRLSYDKGSYLLHMLRWKLGDSVFFHGLRRYINDPSLQYNFAFTTDFKRNLELESGQDLTSFFQKWYYGEGYPTYTVNWTQDSNNLVFVKMDQVTSHPSVSFYDMPVPLEFHNSTNDTTIVFNNTKNGQTFLVNPGFRADTVIFDPHFWILSRNNSILKNSCDNINDADSLFPHYKIEWAQNNNKWVNLNIIQDNPKADSSALKIPFIIHFTGNGNDTAIAINNFQNSYNDWLNIGFKVTNVSFASSCFLNKSYSINAASNGNNPNDIKVYPIPAYNNQVYISLKNPTGKKLQIQIYNAIGQLVYLSQFNTPGKNELFSIPLSNLAKGNYIIRLQNETGLNFSKRIIK